MWTYAWIVAPTIATGALAANLIVQGYVVTGCIFVVLALVTLLVALVKEKLERFNRAGAYYSVEADRAVLQFTLPQYMALPPIVRERLAYDERIKRWRDDEIERHGRRLGKEAQTRIGWMRYRLREWFFAFFS